MANPIVKPFFHSGSNTWTYVITDPVSRHAVIVDPVLDFEQSSGRTATVSAAKVLAYVREQQLMVEWVLETHAHADHLSAGHWLRQKIPTAKLGIGAGICEVQKTFSDIFNLGEHFPVDGSQFDHLFTDGEIFKTGELSIQVLATPGHTNDSVSYLVGNAVFVGDTLFMPDSGTARCDFPGGSAVQLFQSIWRLFALPATTRVFVCHDYAPGGREIACETTIAAQLDGNIHVHRGIDEQEYVSMRMARDATLTLPALILPSIQVNIQAGALPEPESNGVSYLKLPFNAL